MLTLAEIRFVIRGLVRNPTLVLVAVGTLAAAVAFNGASTSLLDGLLLHPYPYPELQQLMLVRDARLREGAHQGRPLAVADFLDVRDSATAFASLAAWRPQALVVTSQGADPERIEGAAVSANFFATLGVTPLLGRAFPSDADQPGHDDIVLFSRRLWASRFGAAPDIVGREVTLNGRRALVAGIVGDADCYPSGVDAWTPLVLTPADRSERAAQTIAGIGRLARDRSQGDARGELASIAARLAAAYPLTNRERGFDTLPMRREQYEFTAPLFGFVQAAAILVLLLAAINVASLLVGRTLDRQREFAVRTFIGASRRAIVFIVFAEALLLAGTASILGAAGAGAILGVVRASLPDGIARWIAGWSAMSVSRGPLIAAGSLGIAAGIAIGIAAAVSALGSLAEPQVVAARATRRRTRGRRLLIAGEVGLTATLVLGATVMVNGLDRMRNAYGTLAPDRLLRFTLTLPESRYPDATRTSAFHSSLLAALRARPDIASAALIRNEPASNVPSPTTTFQIVDAPAASPGDLPRADLQTVSPEIFGVMRIDIVEGRSFAATDASGSAPVAIVSREAVRRFWSGRRVVGAQIRIGDRSEAVQIVGVASDAALNWYDPQMRPVIYVPDAQAPARTVAVLVRTRADPLAVAREARSAVTALDDRQPISGLEPMSTTIADSLSPVRVIERLMLAGATVSALLAAIGIYGVLAHWVRARRRELGIRYALGASRTGIAALVLREAFGTAAAGAVIGFLSGVLLVRLARTELLGIPAVDPRMLAVIAIVTAGITAIAALMPARRASQIDIAELLRLE